MEYLLPASAGSQPITGLGLPRVELMGQKSSAASEPDCASFATVTRKAKEATKTALAMTLAYWIALSQGWEKPMWAGVAAAFVSLGTIGQSFDKATLRMVGTFVAAGVSFALLGCFAQDRWAFMLGLSAWAGYCTYRIG